MALDPVPFVSAATPSTARTCSGRRCTPQPGAGRVSARPATSRSPRSMFPVLASRSLPAAARSSNRWSRPQSYGVRNPVADVDSIQVPPSGSDGPAVPPGHLPRRQPLRRRQRAGPHGCRPRSRSEQFDIIPDSARGDAAYPRPRAVQGVVRDRARPHRHARIDRYCDGRDHRRSAAARRAAGDDGDVLGPRCEHGDAVGDDEALLPATRVRRPSSSGTRRNLRPVELIITSLSGLGNSTGKYDVQLQDSAGANVIEGDSIRFNADAVVTSTRVRPARDHQRAGSPDP